MAVTYSSISSDLQSAYTADKPLFLGRNVLETGTGLDVTDGTGPETISACWRASSSTANPPSAGTTTSYDNPIAVSAGTVSGSVLSSHEYAFVATDSWQSPLKAFDRDIGGLTSTSKNQGSVSQGKFYCYQYNARIPANTVYGIDTIILANHNFAEIQEYMMAQKGVADSVELYVAVYLAAAPFVTGSHNDVNGDPVSTVAQWKIGHPVSASTPSGTATKRLVCYDLGSYGNNGLYQSFTNVQYIQISVFQKKVPGIPPPQIGEVFMGPRRQMSRTPETSTFDQDRTSNATAEFVSESGIRSRYRITAGKEVFEPVWNPSGDPDLGTKDLYNLDDLATLDELWKDISYGAEPFFFVPKPYSEPTQAYFTYAEEPEFLSSILGGLTEREVLFTLNELSPYVSSEFGSSTTNGAL